ncbi:sugar ABC transporter substrate-binding protein [Rhodococcus opacus]|uniref:sugar ABC transporter substrate-binding protein n=1 Tax=Rhodococcus opacus TaxID=37919 RepID=UPI001C487D89|nr:sugar ABC transporter substrate-binding protein [Rhodococcus opacus]MBV6759860.1 sugar ABC transporter substrate-binding protein [Rhodococcus opacus]
MAIRHVTVGAALALTGVLALTGCGRGGDNDGTPVGFSAGFLDSPFNSGLVKAVEAQANADGSGLSMLPATDAQSDPGKQITDINTLLTQGVQGLVMFPSDSDAIVPAIEAANAKNAPVVTVDIAGNGGDIYMNIRADNVAMGRSVCEQLGAITGGKGRVLEIHGDLGTSSGFDRNQGFNECMASKFPGVEVVSRDAKWKTDQAVDVAQTTLSTQDFDGVFLASDSVMYNGVKNVMSDMGKLQPVGTPGHVPLVTIDGTKEALQGVRDGYVDAVVSQPVDLYGKYAVQYLKDALAGKQYQPGPTDHASTIVDYKGNLADMLPAPVVTTANVDETSLWGNQS